MPVKDEMLDQMMSDLESSEKEFKNQMAPPSDFSPKEVSSTLTMMKPILSLFGETEIDPELFPSYLEMMVKSVNDAVSSGAIDEELSCEMPVTDVDLKYLKGKLKILSKPKNIKAFKSFLEESASVPVEETPEEVVPEPTRNANPILEALR